MGIETAIGLGLGLASTVAGGMMQANAAKRNSEAAMQQAAARNKQLQEYRERMAKIQEDAQNNNVKTQEQYQPEQAKAREDAANQQLNQQYTGAISQPAPLNDIPLGGSAPQVSADAKATATDRTDAYTKNLASKLAALGTQPQSLLQSGIGLQRAGSLNDQYVNFGKQETALLPQYQDFASTYWRLKPQESSPGGSALSGLGSTFLKMAGSGFGG